ncbi:MAG TPA: pitrilysin family protein [Clostridia bacterium]|nr:MAG: Protease 3 precursor [Firmicutes bacterium ADurb.Bin146]HOD92592.1 pitrilysin family protein [Clostridia bacterium]HQM39954.1 pitrilysin family protein [Clostridia bacterium]
MIEIKKLINGTRVIFEHMPANDIISIGIFVKAGSNYENAENKGISHFIEHMAFKGTYKKSAKDIAIISDQIGGMLNAYTGKDMTCFYIKTTSDNVNTALELMADMLLNSSFESAMIENEKKIIIEEIAMYEDSPEDFVHDRLEEAMWKGNPLSYPILGSYDTVMSFSEEDIKTYMKEFYVTSNTVISISGSFDQQAMMQKLNEYFKDYINGECEKANNGPLAVFRPVDIQKTKKIEQAYLSMAFKGALHDSDERYPFAILSGALGQSMSSRLFQIVREEKALVYNIGSSNEFYQTGGILNIYAGCNPAKFEQMMESIQEIIEDITKNGLDDDEIARARDQIKCSMMLGMETTDSRMMSNGRNLLLRGRPITREEAITKTDEVSKKDIQNIINKYIDWEHKAVSILRPAKARKKN